MKTKKTEMIKAQTMGTMLNRDVREMSGERSVVVVGAICARAISVIVLTLGLAIMLPSCGGGGGFVGKGLPIPNENSGVTADKSLGNWGQAVNIDNLRNWGHEK